MKKCLFSMMLAVLLLTLASSALAASITVTFTADATNKEKGQALFDTVKAAAAGDTIILPAGTYQLDNNTSRLQVKNGMTLVGAGTDKTTIVSDKYGIVLQNDDPNSRMTVGVQNMTISSTHSWAHAIYAKNNLTANLKNLVLTTVGSSAILMDSSNAIGGQYYDGITTIVNASNVTIDSGDIIEFNGIPCSSTDASGERTTYVQFNFDSSCTNISQDICKPQNVSIGMGNLFVNGSLLNPLTDPADAVVEVGQQATFTVETTVGKNYQWYVNRKDGNGFVAIDGATSASYTTDPVEAAWNGFQYFCRVNGVQDSATATLRVKGVAAAAPTTGDSAHPGAWLAILFASAVMMSLLSRKALKAR